MHNQDRRWNGFPYLFDEDKYIPSVAAVATYFLNIYELELRCSNPIWLEDDSQLLSEILVGTAICESGELALAEQPSTTTTCLLVELRADEEFSARKAMHCLRTGGRVDLDPEVNATISYFSGVSNERDDTWILSIYLSNSQFSTLKNFVLSRSARDITVGLKSQETLTNAYNEHSADSRRLKWFLPDDGDGKPIVARCKTAVFAFGAGERWPPTPLNKLEEAEPAESQGAGVDQKNDTSELVHVMLSQHAQIIQRLRMISWLMLAIVVLVVLFAVRSLFA